MTPAAPAPSARAPRRSTASPARSPRALLRERVARRVDLERQLGAQRVGEVQRIHARRQALGAARRQRHALRGEQVFDCFALQVFHARYHKCSFEEGTPCLSQPPVTAPVSISRKPAAGRRSSSCTSSPATIAAGSRSFVFSLAI